MPLMQIKPFVTIFKVSYQNQRLELSCIQLKKLAPQNYKFYPEDSIFDFDIGNVYDYTRLRAIVNFISGMTDKYAVSFYQKLCGLKL